MPVIKEFDAGNLGLQPSEIGPEAAAGAARRIGGFSNQVGQATEQFGERTGQMIGSDIRTAGDEAVAHIDHQQITEGGAMGAKMFANLTQEKNAIVAGVDPNDPQYGQKVESALTQWRETTLESRLQDFSSGFRTKNAQDWADRFAANTREHMFNSTAADISTAAKVGIDNSIRTFTNSASNTALNDPSAMPGLLDAASHTVTGMVGSSNLKGTDIAEVQTKVLENTREQIVKSAAIGTIMKTGQVPDWVTDPKYSKYVNGIELKSFQKQAEAQQRSNIYYQKQTELIQKQQADLSVHKSAAELIANGVTVDPNNPGRVLIDPKFVQGAIDIARKNSDAPSAAATARTMVDWAEQQQRERAEPVVSDPGTKSSLLFGMGNPDKPTTEIDVLRAEADNKISTRDGTLLRSMVKEMGPEVLKDPIVHSAMAAAGERVGESLLVDGKERYASFMQTFLPEYMRQKRAGTLPPNALDLKDDKSLISQSLKQFEPTMQQRMMAHAAKALGVSNLSDMNVTGVDVQNAAPFTPPKTWQYSASRDQFRDPGSGKVYDRAGHEVK